MALYAGAAAALASFSAGTTLVAIRAVSGDTDPLTITVWRIAAGAVLLLPFALLWERGWPRGRDIIYVVALGVLMFGIGQWLVSASLFYTSAARGGIIASVTPFLALTMATLWRIERFTWLKLAGAACASAGVAMALWQDASGVPGGWRGDLLMFAAATAVAAFSVAGSRVARRYPPLIFVVSTMAAGTLFLLVVASFTSGLSVRIDGAPATLAAFAYIAIAGSVVTYGMTLWALRHTTPTRVAIAITMNPIGALAGAALVLGEPLTPGLLAGLVAIILGLVLANRQPKRQTG